MQYCPSTETRLTSLFGMGRGEPRPYGRPIDSIKRLFINISADLGFLFHNYLKNNSNPYSQK